MKVNCDSIFLFLLWLSNHVICWTPITHPAAYTVQQTFSDQNEESISRVSNKNILLHSDSIDSFGTIHSNEYSNEVIKQTGSNLVWSYSLISDYLPPNSRQTYLSMSRQRFR